MTVTMLLICMITGQLFAGAIHYNDWMLGASGGIAIMALIILSIEEHYK